MTTKGIAVTQSLAILMDPIEAIKIEKDSSFAMLLEAQRRGWKLHYLTPDSLFALDGIAYARSAELSVMEDSQCWHQLGPTSECALGDFDVILMRKDPPFNMEFVYISYLLDLAKDQGAMVVNDPSSLRNFNEKFSIMNFPQCCAPTIVSKDRNKIRAFLEQHQTIVSKPMDAMGGESIFKLEHHDSNSQTIIDEATEQGTQTIMCQRFLKEISAGDKRILLIRGEPIPYALARVPQGDEFRANLNMGGRGHGVELTDRDRWICAQLKQTLLDNGIIFAGIDVIGDYLTEINITSPTCIRQLDTLYNLNISAVLFDAIEDMLEA